METIFAPKQLTLESDKLIFRVPNAEVKINSNRVLTDADLLSIGVQSIGEPEIDVENGAKIEDNALILGIAGPTDPGIVTTDGQSFMGLKNFGEGIQFNFGWVLDTHLFDQNGIVPTVNGGATFTTITTEGQGVASLQIKVWRLGLQNMVGIPQFTLSGGAGTPTIITFPAAVPADHRPAVNTEFTVGIVHAGFTRITALVLINATNGNITITSAALTSPYGFAAAQCFTYYV